MFLWEGNISTHGRRWLPWIIYNYAKLGMSIVPEALCGLTMVLLGYESYDNKFIVFIGLTPQKHHHPSFLPSLPLNLQTVFGEGSARKIKWGSIFQGWLWPSKKLVSFTYLFYAGVSVPTCSYFQLLLINVNVCWWFWNLKR